MRLNRSTIPSDCGWKGDVRVLFMSRSSTSRDADTNSLGLYARYRAHINDKQTHPQPRYYFCLLVKLFVRLVIPILNSVLNSVSSHTPNAYFPWHFYDIPNHVATTTSGTTTWCLIRPFTRLITTNSFRKPGSYIHNRHVTNGQGRNRVVFTGTHTSSTTLALATSLYV